MDNNVLILCMIQEITEEITMGSESQRAKDSLDTGINLKRSLRSLSGLYKLFFFCRTMRKLGHALKVLIY